ncbi:helix-turn-helix domain-containing protein [Methylobacterium sp. 77]|uniref:helix-turn-helix domain-containing protein n=1 Tax=Methylobacterium sp. 77 TaxID=1101192 RepID=UPI000364B66F|nr:helix-turn-helix domain-containing protein [Methylobacterium sp. 77]
MRCSINAGVTRSPGRVDHFFAHVLAWRIGLDLGYADAAHFTRAFRGWTGLPPTEWRRLAEGLETGPPMGR